MIRYDCHTHTEHSPDSRQGMRGLIDAALAAGLSGIAVTDHADVGLCPREDLLARIAASVGEAARADGREGLEVLCGIELAEERRDRAFAAELLASFPCDVVLGSVHTVFTPEIAQPYSRVNFGALSVSARRRFLDAYFDAALCLASEGDYDSLAHLTCPLRYITGKYGIGLDFDGYRDVICEILSAVIRRGKSLEVNTSGLREASLGMLMPDVELLRLYRSLGGERITVGSDAHAAPRVANRFAEAERRLLALGFDSYVYYRRRRPIRVDFLGV